MANDLDGVGATKVVPSRLVSNTLPRRPEPALAVTRGGKEEATDGRSLPAEERREIAEADVEKAIERLTELARQSRRNLQFRVDQSSGRTVITVINAATQEIVRQIPPQEILSIAHSIGGWRRALLMDRA